MKKILVFLTILALQACSFNSAFYIKNETNESVKVSITHLPILTINSISEMGGLRYGSNRTKIKYSSYENYNEHITGKINGDTLSFEIPPNSNVLIGTTRGAKFEGYEIIVNHSKPDLLRESSNLHQSKNGLNYVYVYQILENPVKITR